MSTPELPPLPNTWVEVVQWAKAYGAACAAAEREACAKICDDGGAATGEEYGQWEDAARHPRKGRQLRKQKPVKPPHTGWPPGMLQDDSRELSKWFASKPGAKRQAQEVALAIKLARGAN